MAAVNKIDSNSTGLRYAEETTYNTTPSSATWYPLEPNEYDDFGGELTLVARNPINDGRQRKKGVITDLDASGGFTTDWTQDNLTDLLQGFFFADIYEFGVEAVTAVDLDTTNPDEYEVASTTGFSVGNLIIGENFDDAANNALNVVTAVVSNVSVEVADGQLVADASPATGAKIRMVGHQFTVASSTFEVDASGTLPTLTQTGLLSTGWVTDLGLRAGDWIYIGGDSATKRFFNSANNGFKRIRSVTETVLTFDKSSADMITDDGSDTGSAGTFNLTIQVFIPKTLKNLTGTSITRRSYHLERALGAPDDASPSQIQYEYLTGAVPSEMTLNIPVADKITMDLSFQAANTARVDGPTAALDGSRTNATLVEADAFNTSSDFSRIRLAVVSDSDEAPDALFTYAEEISISLNNNLNALKAVGTLGSFDVSAGTFEVTGDITAYFADTASIDSVAANSDITLDFAIYKSNAGIVVDIPLIALGDGRLEVEQDEAIKLPLSMEAATGAKISSDLDHTLLFAFFPYLPTLADTVA